MAAGARKERVEGNSNVVQFYNFMVRRKGTRRHASILEGLGHCGEHPAKSGNRASSEKAPTGEACQIGCTTPMQAQPWCCGKGSTTTKKFLYNPVMSFAFPYTPSSRFR